MHSFIHTFYTLRFILCIAVFTVSCENDLKEVQRVSLKSSDPDERTKNMEIIMTDDGFAKIQLFATLMETYSTPEEITKIKDGLKVNFFDTEGKVSSILTSKYGEMKKNEKIMLVRDSVELYSIVKEQRLETEELFWNQNDSTIYTYKPVKVTTKTGILYGEGIRSNQEFTIYEFLSPTGSFSVKN